jgi:hypothetical protein
MSRREFHDEPAFIYAIVNKWSGIVIYVGKTLTPVPRWHDHAVTKSKVNNIGKNFKMVILARASSKTANAVERRFIALFKKCGQCSKNKSLGTAKKSKPVADGLPIHHLESGEIYYSFAHAARMLDMSPTQISKAFRLYGGKLREGMTFKISKKYPDGRLVK